MDQNNGMITRKFLFLKALKSDKTIFKNKLKNITRLKQKIIIIGKLYYLRNLR